MMGSEWAIAAALALGACTFDSSTMSGADNGDGSPSLDGAQSGDSSQPVDGSPSAADATNPCVLPFIIDDHFENTDLTTAGATSVGSGFSVEVNSSGNGTSAEVPGELLEIRTSSNASGAEPVQGVASNTSFAFDSANGMTIRLEVTSAETPIWNGIVLGLQSNQSSPAGSGSSLMLRVRGSQPRAFTIGMGTNFVNDDPVSAQPYDEAALADGFVITWVLEADSWSYVAEGFLTNGAPITDSGSYGFEQSPSDLLDDTTHVAVHMQGAVGDATQRVMRVGRLSVMTGVCPE